MREEQALLALALCNNVIAKDPGSMHLCWHGRVFLRHRFPWNPSEAESYHQTVFS
jgi:hypothetical protein